MDPQYIVGSYMSRKNILLPKFSAKNQHIVPNGLGPTLSLHTTTWNYNAFWVRKRLSCKVESELILYLLRASSYLQLQLWQHQKIYLMPINNSN